MKTGGAALASGDVIASINGVPILNAQDLRKAIRGLIGAKPFVLQIERRGQFLCIERELE